jgi:hypothetical protein
MGSVGRVIILSLRKTRQWQGYASTASLTHAWNVLRAVVIAVPCSGIKLPQYFPASTPSAPFSPFPLVYNLRSSVGEGMTTIRWSANPSEVAGCVFGVWYSPDSPVDVSRPPDNTVWYSNTMTEYQTSFQQNAPAYVAVAPIRTGNESEVGIVKELCLDWNNAPPRAPDDVVLLNKPLPGNCLFSQVFIFLFGGGLTRLKSEIPKS